MGDYGSSRPNRAGFAGVVADCDDEIEFGILEFIHRLAAGIGGRKLSRRIVSAIG